MLKHHHDHHNQPPQHLQIKQLNKQRSAEKKLKFWRSSLSSVIWMSGTTVATFFVFWTEDKKNSAVDIEHWGKTS
ncbi:MAG: F0F1-type ATP synthase membrane subunit a [Bacillariaceae sp.]|jgi:F0F1-type ATP synthase membrane subunit a